MNQSSSEQETTKEATASPSPRRRAAHVLLAEDDDEMRKLLALSLREDGFDVTECRHGIELLDHLKAFGGDKPVGVDLIISDIRMPGVTGMSVLEGLFQTVGSPPMIMITAFGDAETHARAERLGAIAMFDKPFDIDDLLAKARELAPPTAPTD